MPAQLLPSLELLPRNPLSSDPRRIEIFELCEKGYVRVLWNICTNPAVSMTDRRRQLETLKRVFLIVQDCFADTETASTRLLSTTIACGFGIPSSRDA